MDANELALVFRARGETPEDAAEHAHRVFQQLAAHPSGQSGPIAVRTALSGNDSGGAGEEVGTPWRAAISSFIFFAAGAFIPLIPYIFAADGLPAVIIAAALVGIALLMTGGMVGVLSGQDPMPVSYTHLTLPTICSV